ncbi:putative phage-related endonuclease [Bradyrhizobium sp. USDA 4474]
MDTRVRKKLHADSRTFISGSDALVIMGDDQDKLIRLWREKRGEALPLDLSNDLIVQLGRITEHLNRRLYERASGHKVQDLRRPVLHPIHKWMRADLHGLVRDTGAVFAACFLPSGHFSEPEVANLHMAQLQHSLWVMAARSALLSIITGDGKWIEMTVPADPLYQHLLLTAEKKFVRCVQTGEPPALFGIEAPRPRPSSIKVIDMSVSGHSTNFPASHLKARDAPSELQNSQRARR